MQVNTVEQSSSACCNCSTPENRAANARCVLDAVTIIVCIFSGVGLWMAIGVLGGGGLLSFWFMLIYTIMASVIMCNCCQCGPSSKYDFSRTLFSARIIQH